MERTDLYDDFDIHHEMLSNESFTAGVYAAEDMKSIETQRTNMSERGTGRALIPETGIESKHHHTRHISNPDYSPSPKLKSRKKTYDLTKDSCSDLGDRFA